MAHEATRRNDIPLNQALPATLGKVVQANLVAGETILVQLKGAFNEALVCTSRRVMIAKSGFMTGQMFGSDVFQVPYGNITSAEVKYGIMSGYFQVSAGGVQNTVKSYWSTGRESSPRKAPNCVSLDSKPQAASFRAACAFIMKRIEQSRQAAEPPSARSETDIAASLERLWKLKTEGAIDRTEYEAAKGRLLGN